MPTAIGEQWARYTAYKDKSSRSWAAMVLLARRRLRRKGLSESETELIQSCVSLYQSEGRLKRFQECREGIFLREAAPLYRYR